MAVDRALLAGCAFLARYFTRRGALIYVRLGKSSDLPPEIVAGDPRYPLLLRGKGFRIDCLRPQCPEPVSPQPKRAPAGA